MRRLVETLRKADADRPLFQRGAEWVRAGALRAMAAEAARHIENHPGDVFVHVDSAAHFVAALLAAARHGRACILPAHTQQAYLDEIGCADAALLNDALFSFIAGQDAPPGMFDAAAEDISMVFFTSGSTGAPKRVETTLSRLEIQTRTLHRLWGEQAGHVRGTVSHQHIYGLLFRVLWPLLSDRTADDRAALYWEEIEQAFGRDVTLVSSPAHLTRLPPHEAAHPDPPGLVFSSGQALPFEAARACASWLGQAPVEVLGSTETGGIAWRRQTEPDAAWTPFPDVNVSAGESDLLEVRSPYLMNDQPQRTGDALDIAADGRFRLRAREDRIEKIDGKRVSLARVEHALRGLPDIAQAVSLTLPARKLALAAVVRLTDEGEDKLRSLGAFRLSRHLRAALAETLEPAERPKHWRFVETIPSDAQGKHTLSALRALFAANPLAPLDLDIVTQDESTAEIRFTLAPDLIYFSGHFPEHPILPGLAQVHIARLIAEQIWGFEPPSSDLSRMKFRHVLKPGDQITLKLAVDRAKGVLRYQYVMNGGEAAAGELGGQRKA